jgi:ABC-type lipoprotein export system ATPase subunit
MTSEPILIASHVSRTYGRASEGKVVALPEMSIAMERHVSCAIVGPSGCGKTTLLNVLSVLEEPSTGEVSILGENVYRMSMARRAAFRRDHVGFVFQNFCLLGERTVAENVEIPLLYRARRAQERRKAIHEWTGRLGIGELLDRRPSELSGGQQQRVAIARAMVAHPTLVFADEPTGSLDAKTGKSVIQALLQSCRETGATCIIVTHDPAVAALCDVEVDLMAHPPHAAQ